MIDQLSLRAVCAEVPEVCAETFDIKTLPPGRIAPVGGTLLPFLSLSICPDHLESSEIYFDT